MSTLTSIENKIRAITPELEDVLAVLQVIQNATKIGGPAAATGLAVVAAALKSLDDHAAGAITHDQFLAQVLQGHADLAADRAAEDAALAAKFPEP